MRTLSAEYYAPKVNPEYEAALDASESRGYTDGLSGNKPNSKGLFHLHKTVYFQGFKAGQETRASLIELCS